MHVDAVKSTQNIETHCICFVGQDALVPELALEHSRILPEPSVLPLASLTHA